MRDQDRDSISRGPRKLMSVDTSVIDPSYTGRSQCLVHLDKVVQKRAFEGDETKIVLLERVCIFFSLSHRSE